MKVQHVPTRSPRRLIQSTIESLERRVLLSTYTVSNLNGAGPGSLSDAIQQANAHAGADTITFAPGLSGTITSGAPTITDDLTITGPGRSVLAISGGLSLDAYAGPNRSPSLDVSGLTTDGVSGDYFGTSITLTDCALGGVDNYGSTVIRGCTISGGTGIVARGPFDISDTTISNCKSTAIYLPIGGRGYVSLTNCMITGNPGDGIYDYDGTVILTHSSVSDNGGYGIYDPADGIDNVIDSTVSNNGNSGLAGVDQAAFAVSGSTIANNRGSGITYVALTMTNSTVANNMGGGINGDGGLTVANSTVVGNTGTTGAGISIGIRFRSSLNNTIVAGNHDANGAPSDLTVNAVGTPYFTASNNLIGTGGSGGLVNGKDGNIVGVADPKLAPLGDYGGTTQTMPPLAGSPAIDAGSNALAVGLDGKPLITDQRGYARYVNGTVDIGSVEYGSAPLKPGDTNGDGKVDFADLVVLARNYGKTAGASWSDGDCNGDGKVNFADLVLLAQNYGKSASAAESFALALRSRHARA